MPTRFPTGKSIVKALSDVSGYRHLAVPDIAPAALDIGPAALDMGYGGKIVIEIDEAKRRWR